MDSSLSATSTGSAFPPSATSGFHTVDDSVSAHHANPVVAFIIGLAIILLASLLNAAGLNLTKLDHVRTSAIPRAERKKDWLRPLWLFGMVLYVLSQLIGSTLALEYMRAEYVAPLGSSSLIFNFLFARFLVGTPVTKTDIYGTIVVVAGVIGIVAFGSINSGLASETDVEHLTQLWRRSGWLTFFFFMSFALASVLLFTNSLDAILAARSDIGAEPFAGMSARRPQREPAVGFGRKVKATWDRFLLWVKEVLEAWTAPKDDKQIAWTLGIGWACCGGGLAGGCLVFAKAAVKLISGSLSHTNTGNQFGHAAPIFTFLLLGLTAVLQIICLNKGLKVYDSTLVVPVFYGVYTATGFLDSLIFNNETDAYRPLVLFSIFMSIVILISGVVLLTSKKPESSKVPRPHALGSLTPRKPNKSTVNGKKSADVDDDGDEEAGLRGTAEDEAAGASEVVWQVGDVSDDEDETGLPAPARSGLVGASPHEEGHRLMGENDDDHGNVEHHRQSSETTVTAYGPGPDRADPFQDPEEFGEWKDAHAFR